MALAMHSRCCCPPDNPAPGPIEPVLDLFPQVRLFQALSTMPSMSFLDLPDTGEPVAGAHVVVHGHGRERVGLLEHHPDRAADVHRVDSGPYRSCTVQPHGTGDPAAEDHLVHPVEGARTVDFPHPDGPMNAVTVSGAMVMVAPSHRQEISVVDIQIFHIDAHGHLESEPLD